MASNLLRYDSKVYLLVPTMFELGLLYSNVHLYTFFSRSYPFKDNMESDSAVYNKRISAESFLAIMSVKTK